MLCLLSIALHLRPWFRLLARRSLYTLPTYASHSFTLKLGDVVDIVRCALVMEPSSRLLVYFCFFP
jgi:hypothetical protein